MMPLINGLMFLVLAGVGLAGYVLTRHFELLEAKRYLDIRSEPVDAPDAPNRPVVVHMYNGARKTNGRAG